MSAVDETTAVRLQKILAQAGICSRRGCEALIAAGRVTVNGDRAVVGQKIQAADAIAVDGRPVQAHRQGFAYYALNKPRGVVSTVRDEWGRRTVLDLVRPPARVYPVGRLDADSEGLVLLTNDGELAHRLTHPRYQVPKVYEVEARGSITEAELVRLQRGIRLDDGPARAAEAVLLSRMAAASLVRLVMTEGRKHEVRRLLAAIGHEVLSLRRTAIGPLALGALEVGRWRTLSAEEVGALRGAVRLGEAR